MSDQQAKAFIDAMIAWGGLPTPTDIKCWNEIVRALKGKKVERLEDRVAWITDTFKRGIARHDERNDELFAALNLPECGWILGAEDARGDEKPIITFEKDGKPIASYRITMERCEHPERIDEDLYCGVQPPKLRSIKGGKQS